MPDVPERDGLPSASRASLGGDVTRSEEADAAQAGQSPAKALTADPVASDDFVDDELCALNGCEGGHDPSKHIAGHLAATPPARLTTTEWQRQNAAEVRAEQADEIRAAIREALCTTLASGVSSSKPRPFSHHDEHDHVGICALCMSDANALTGALMDRVIGPALAELDAAEEREDAAERERDELRRQLEAESAAQALLRDERDRLREADARVRAWAQSWAAHTDPGHALQGAARQVLAALDGTVGEGR